MEHYLLQIFTANKLVLESQTFNRVLETIGVLPTDMSKLVNTPNEERARVYAKHRVRRYQREPNAERLQQIKDMAKNNPKSLQLLIFDEAHFGATSNTRKEKQKTPYEYLIDDFNSDDYPNVIVLLVTATPWNLMTAASKIPKTEALRNDQGTLEIVTSDTGLSAKNNHSKFPLHEVEWNQGQEGNFQKGKQIKLKALLENYQQHFIQADFQENIIKTLPIDEIDDSSYDEATVFTIKGSLFESVQISCKNCENEELFWTWPEQQRHSTIRLRPKATDPSKLKFQKFTLIMQFGSDMTGFVPYGEDGVTLYLTKHEDESVGKVALKSERLGGNANMPQRATPRRCFLFYPKTRSTKFYFSLNHLYNSMADPNPKRQYIRHDERFSAFLRKAKRSEKLTQSDLLTADYCLVVLLRQVLFELEGEFNDLNYEGKVKAIKERIIEAKENIDKFVKLLNPRLKINQHHKPICPDAFQEYLQLMYKSLNPASAKETNVFVRHVLAMYLGEGKVLSMPEAGKLMNNLESQLDPLGASGIIVKKCLQKYQPDSDKPNGHMAIIRASNKRKENGNVLKQSLCIAKKIARIDLEIIQDYGDQTTLSLKHHAVNAVKDANRFENPEHLRIMKKIQTNKCLKVDGKGASDCFCTSYSPRGEESLTCVNCNHIHKEFKSYADLLGLPCLLILVNKGQIGDTFPHSLVGIDDRGATVTSEEKEANLNLTTFAQEKGRLCRYTTLESNLPFVYVGEGLYNQLLKSLKKDCAYWHSFVYVTKRIDCLVTVTSNGELIPKNRSTDANKRNKPRLTFILFKGEPQIGKTGVFLQLIAKLRQMIEPQVDFDHEFEPDFSNLLEEDETGDDYSLPESQFQSVVPHWETMEHLPRIKHSIAKCGYSFPIENAPNIIKEISPPNGSHWPKEKSTHDLITYSKEHFCVSKCSFDAHPGDLIAEFGIEEPDWFVGKIRIFIPDLEHYHEFINGTRNDQQITIMTPSINRIRFARINWYHLMENTSGNVEPYLHFVFVRKGEAEEYARERGNFVAIVEVPDEMKDVEVNVYQGGIGFIRRFIQRFAHYMRIEEIYLCDDSIVSFRAAAKTMDGQLATNEKGEIQMENVSFYDVDLELRKIGSDVLKVPDDIGHYNRHPEFVEYSNKIASYSGPRKNYGIMGICKYRPDLPRKQDSFNKVHVSSFMKINVKALTERNILFPPWKTHDDLHLCNEVDQAGLHVLQLNHFQYVKACSSDPLGLYIWHEKQTFGKLEIRVGQKTRMRQVMWHFMKSLVCSNVHGSFDENFPFPPPSKKSHSEGIDLILSNDMSFSLEGVTNQEIVVIFPMPQDLRNLSFGIMKDTIRGKISGESCIDEFIVGSTHKPGEVEKDFIVLQIRLKRNLKRTRSASVNGTALGKRCKRNASSDDYVGTPRSTRPPSIRALRKVKEESDTNEESEDSGMTSESEHLATIENNHEENPYKNFYPISALQSKGYREIGTEYSAIVVYVSSNIFKNPVGTKNCVLVEDIGRTQGHHSCLMFWHSKDKPRGLAYLKAKSIVRITNVRTKMSEDELFHSFQLKLSNRSQIQMLPPKPLPFYPQSVFSVLDVFFDFFDVQASLRAVTMTENEGQDVLLCVFKDEKSDEEFELMSEPSNMSTCRIFDTCRNKTFKIRSARVWQRSRDRIILYKNFDAILYYNQNKV